MTTTFWRSTRAIVAAIVIVIALSLGTDLLFHLLRVYPPWGVRMSDGLFALATPSQGEPPAGGPGDHARRQAMPDDVAVDGRHRLAHRCFRSW